MQMKEKASYLKGLADGLDLDKSTKEGKLIAALLDAVDMMAEKIDELDAFFADKFDFELSRMYCVF